MKTHAHPLLLASEAPHGVQVKRAAPRRGQRGFTMIELLVATVAGLFVAMATFSFSKAATRSFQSEARIGNTTNNTMLGFRRLTGDIERAGFLATPSIQRDYFVNKVCQIPNAPMPQSIRDLAAVQVERGNTYTPTDGVGYPSPPYATDTMPDRITLTGSYSTTEQFWLREARRVSGTQFALVIDPTSGAYGRVAQGDATLAPWTRGNTPAGILIPNRIIKLIDQQGFHHYGVIQSVSLSGPGLVRVLLNQTPIIPVPEDPTTTTPKHPNCDGFTLSAGTLMSVVNRIRYEVRHLRAVPGFANLYGFDDPNPPGGVKPPDPATLPEEANRRELVRYEIDSAGNIMAGSYEVVAEYAVDLKVGGTVATAMFNGPQFSPQVVRYEPGDPPFYAAAQAASSYGINQPGSERIRSLRVRLGLRSREVDRSSDVDPIHKPFTMGAKPGGFARFQVLTDNGGMNSPIYARVRTLQTEVFLSNQANVTW